MQRALLFAAVVFVLSGSSGCIIPYAFPKMDFTRTLQLEAPAEGARFFRADTAQITWPYPVYVEERLAEIQVSNSGQVAAQYKPSFRNGVYLFMGALNYDFGQGRHLALRAYRPGFELVEIGSMEQVDLIEWIPAENLAAQERAIDSLVPIEKAMASNIQMPGSRSAKHRDALLFGASEYERLAGIAESREMQSRLQEKARKLRDRADE